MPMLDAEERVIGTVKFTLDHIVPDMAHARILRSPYPHARILEIDTSLALQRPGVICVLTGEDFGSRKRDQSLVWTTAERPTDCRHRQGALRRRPSRGDRRRNGGDCKRGGYSMSLSSMKSFASDATDAAKAQAPTIHDEWPDNECGAWHWSMAISNQPGKTRIMSSKAYSRARLRIMSRMEPHVSIAQWSDDDGSAEVWTSTQSPHGVHGALVEILNTQPEKVRVHTFNLGGGYGAKGGVKLEPMAVCAARKAGRPVRIALTREEVFQTIAKHAATIRIKTGVKSDGTFVAR
ncbi:MAG: molybdopterin cofactor-binding domain-containing protein [Thermomicrobiales bacterium]